MMSLSERLKMNGALSSNEWTEYSQVSLRYRLTTTGLVLTSPFLSKNFPTGVASDPRIFHSEIPNHEFLLKA